MPQMIEIFKTDISQKQARKAVLTAIHEQWPGIVATIDIEDCDRVLRVVGAWAKVPTQEIMNMIRQQGYLCELLTD